MSVVDGLDNATSEEIGGGLAVEADDSLHDRILRRIREPPQGGAMHDCFAWARDVRGVTRAWAAQEALGTVTIRFIMDDNRANDIRLPGDVAAVAAAIDAVRPVLIRGVYVLAPVPHPISVQVSQPARNIVSTRASHREPRGHVPPSFRAR